MRITNREAAKYIKARQPFANANGTLRGDTTPQGLYVVYSYQTVIAYTDVTGALIVPGVRYSQTTTRHQHICRMGA